MIRFYAWFIFALLVLASVVTHVFNSTRTGLLLEHIGQDDWELLWVDGNPVQVEMAATPETRQQGLSGRRKLEAEHGMLFIFDRDGNHRIWMKDMQFAIDVLWVRDNGEIVDIRENLSPDTYPEAFGPSEPVRYILELPAGYVAQHGIERGETMTF